MNSSIWSFLLPLAMLITPTTSVALEAFPPDYQKKRVCISTDIGGGDFDDVQSMIHFLLYSDMFDVECIISSMPRPGSKYWKEIIRAYRRDYTNLSFHSADYPTPRELKRLYRVGAKDTFPSNRTIGARRIIRAVNKGIERNDPRPLHILVWGSSTDLAQAIKIKPKIKNNIQVFLIANYYKKEFNRTGDEAAYQFVIKQKNLRKFVVSDMGRGIYLTGLNSKSKYGNVGFVTNVIRNHGKLGRLFYKRSATINVNKYGLKMGDSTSVFFLMNGDWDSPTNKDSWGGKYCKVKSNTWAGCRDNGVGGHPGAGYVAKHRKEYLKDFENRLTRLDPISLESKQLKVQSVQLNAFIYKIRYLFYRPFYNSSLFPYKSSLTR